MPLNVTFSIELFYYGLLMAPLLAGPGLVLALIVLALFLKTKRGSACRAIAYSCFVLIGGVVATCLVRVVGDGEGAVWLVLGTYGLLGMLWLVAVVPSIPVLKREKPLQLLWLLTLGGLAVSEHGDSETFLYWYAAIYATASMAIPLIVVTLDRRRGRRGYWAKI